MDRAHGDAAQVLEWWRDHWGIENKVHWVRDGTFGEDHSRVSSGSGPQVLAGVRTFVINWLRAHKIENLAAALRQPA